jgi:hypothetical protein
MENKEGRIKREREKEKEREKKRWDSDLGIEETGQLFHIKDL